MDIAIFTRNLQGSVGYQGARVTPGNLVPAIPWTAGGPRDVYFMRILGTAVYRVLVSVGRRQSGNAVLTRNLQGSVGYQGARETSGIY